MFIELVKSLKECSAGGVFVALELGQGVAGRGVVPDGIAEEEGKIPWILDLGVVERFGALHDDLEIAGLETDGAVDAPLGQDHLLDQELLERIDRGEVGFERRGEIVIGRLVLASRRSSRGVTTLYQGFSVAINSFFSADCSQQQKPLERGPETGHPRKRCWSNPAGLHASWRRRRLRVQ